MNVMVPGRKNKRLYGIDILRIISALVVFLFHSKIGEGIACDYGVLNPFIQKGAIFMTVFYMLSGFALYYTNRKSDLGQLQEIKSFYIKRFISIMPAYYLVGIIFLIFLNTETVLDNLMLIPIQLLGLQSVYASVWDRSHNGGTWFISCLILCYVIYPFLQEITKQIGRKTRRVLYFALLLLLIWAPLVALHFNTYFTYTNPFFRIVEFYIGILVACVYEETAQNEDNTIRNWLIILIGGAVFVGLVNVCGHYKLLPEDFMIYDCIVVPFFSLLILTLAKVSVPRVLRSQVVSWLSSISYDFFLVQFFTWEILRFIIARFGIYNNAERIVAGIVINTALAAMLHLVEKKISSILRKGLIRNG